MKSFNKATHVLQAVVFCAAVAACGSDRVVRTFAAPEDVRASRSAPEAKPGVQTMATWNVIALKATAAAPFSPPRESRSLAMVFAAVNDAVCSISRECETYAGRIATSHSASLDAAVAAAAHDVLVSIYRASPAVVGPVNASYESTLATVGASRSRDKGVAAGQAAAANVLAMRANDHSQDPMSYTPTPALGSWVPTPPAFAPALEPQWGAVTPFLLDESSQFRPGPPPAPGSDAYVRDYLEIVSVGEVSSTTRTAWQSEVANFWVSTGPQLWNQVYREMASAPGMDAAQAAHIYMVANLAGADAIIAAWDAKYAYNQWRPVTAIRSSLDDGSSETVQNPTWTSFITTPRFPDYIAGHATYAGAAEQVMTAMFGEHPGTLSITSPTAANATHTYQNFHEIADEISNARVWGGIHWRTSVVVGRAVGQRVGEVAMARTHHRIDADDDADRRHR